jgi:peroxiredoxin
MTISVGDKMPETTFNVMTAEGPGQMTSAELFDGRKVVIFAVPGAFTPTCHMQHLPGFISNADALRAKGVDTIACVSVNDVFVMNAWAEQSGAKGKITFLADGSATSPRLSVWIWTHPASAWASAPSAMPCWWTMA